MYVQFCNEAKSCAYRLVNETLWYETETRPRHLIFSPRRDRDRDLPTFPRDRDETETFANHVSRPSRDRDVETETTSLTTVAPICVIFGRLQCCFFSEYGCCGCSSSVSYKVAPSHERQLVSPLLKTKLGFLKYSVLASWLQSKRYEKLAAQTSFFHLKMFVVSAILLQNAFETVSPLFGSIS